MILAGYACDFPRCTRSQDLRGRYDLDNPARGLESWGWVTAPGGDRHVCSVHAPVVRAWGWDDALAGRTADPDRPGERPEEENA